MPCASLLKERGNQNHLDFFETQIVTQVGFCQVCWKGSQEKGAMCTNLMEQVLSMKSCLAKSSNVNAISTKLQCNKGSVLTWAATGCVGLGFQKGAVISCGDFQKYLCFIVFLTAIRDALVGAVSH